MGCRRHNACPVHRFPQFLPKAWIHPAKPQPHQAPFVRAVPGGMENRPPEKNLAASQHALPTERHLCRVFGEWEHDAEQALRVVRAVIHQLDQNMQRYIGLIIEVEFQFLCPRQRRDSIYHAISGVRFEERPAGKLTGIGQFSLHIENQLPYLTCQCIRYGMKDYGFPGPCFPKDCQPVASHIRYP